MKTVITTVSSLIIPGLGQLFHGKVLWAVGWFVTAIVFGPLVHILSAAHAAWLSA